MSNHGLSAAKGRVDVLILASKLVQELETLERLADKTNTGPMPVEFKIALKSARRLRRMISEASDNRSNRWNHVILSIYLLIKTIKKFHSFFNCKLRMQIKYENGINFKALKSGRWYFPDRIGGGTRCCQNLSFAD